MNLFQLSFLLVQTICFISVDPTWLTSNFLKSGSWKLIDGDAIGRKVGPTQQPTATLTFSGTAFTDVPNLGYGISKYEGDDSLINEKFQVNRTGLTPTSFSVLIQIQGSTYFWILQVRYIAINLLFPHKLVSFDNVPVNYEAGPLTNITTKNPSIQTYSNTINFTKQALMVNSSYTTFTQPFHENKILFFLTSLFILGSNDRDFPVLYPLTLSIQATVLTNETYQIVVIFGIQANIEKLHYSMIIFNQLDVQSSKKYTLVYERVDFVTSGGIYEFKPQFSENFIIGLVDFGSPKTVVAVDFKTYFGDLPNGGFGIYMTPSKPRNPGYLIPLKRFGFTIFYMKTWNCPEKTFLNLTNQKCEGCPAFTSRNSTINFQQQQCRSAEQISSMLQVMQIISYFIMFISIISCKIVGLELFGLLQISYFTLGSHDFINIYLYPLVTFKTLNGLNIPFINENTNLPQSLIQMKVNTLFLNNFNLMGLLLLIQLVIGLGLWVIGKLLRIIQIFNIGLRFLKQGFITLLLFNIFNIGYSTGIFIKYSSSSNQTYSINMFCTVLFIIIFIIGVLSLELTSQLNYGQFKNKFKQNYSSKIYITLSLCFRFIISLYLSLNTNYKQSTLVVLLLCLLFILYIIINTPFKNVYQNYRTCFIHSNMFVILAVTNYYTSMKKNVQLQIKAKLFAPALLQLILIVMSITFSLIILTYQIYQLIKQWRQDQKRQKINFKSQKLAQQSLQSII